MEQRQFDAMMENWLKRQQEGREQKAALEWARRVGITDGTGSHAVATRGEIAGMIYRALDYFFKRIIEVLEKS